MDLIQFQKLLVSTLDEKFSITHIGLMNSDRNPKILWQVLKEICDDNQEFKEDLKIKLIGKIADKITEELKIFETSITEFIPYFKTPRY